MTKISLFTPVSYVKPKSYAEGALSTLSHYFYLGGNQAKVIRNDEVRLEPGKISGHAIALKVASYVLLFPLTLILLSINLGLRYQHNFTVISSSSASISSSVTSIKEKIEPQLYNKLDRKIIGKIWDNNSYNPLEKDELFRTAKYVYTDNNGHLLSSKSWVYDTTTIAYLNWLAVKQPIFSTIPGWTTQFEDKSLENNIDALLSSLPRKIDTGPRIYGHALRVNGNHRTAFVIDMDNHTVEYFNSFGQDTAAKVSLSALAVALTKKYGVNFNYHHRTANIRLQSDTYECGIWTCKLIEERFKQGKNFDPTSLRNFDIAQYRSEVYAKAHKLYFFQQVGRSRYDNYLRQNIDKDGSTEELIQRKNELNNKIYALLKKKFANLSSEDIYIRNAANKFLNSIFIEWGRRSEIPNLMKNLVQQAITSG